MSDQRILAGVASRQETSDISSEDLELVPPLVAQGVSRTLAAGGTRGPNVNSVSGKRAQRVRSVVVDGRILSRTLSVGMSSPSDPPEEHKIKKSKLPLFSSKGRLMNVWNLVSCGLLIYIALSVPFRVAYEDEMTCSAELQTFDLFVDIFFILDIILTFFVDKQVNGERLGTHRNIANYYIRSGNLLADIVISVPVAWISFIWAGGLCTNETDPLFILPKLLRLLRLLRAFRAIKIFSFIQKLGKRHPYAATLVKLAFSITFLGHFAACAWWLTKSADPDLDDWQVQQNVQDGVMSKYILSVYVIATTLTTVGYGDVHGVNDNERIFYTALMCVGATIFATLVSSITSLISSLTSWVGKHQEKLEEIKEFVAFWKIPPDLATRVTEFYVQNAQTCRAHMHRTVLQDVPSNLRTDLSCYLGQRILGHVPLLKNSPDGYLAVLFLLATPLRACPAQRIVSAGQPSGELFLLIKGSCAVVLPKNCTMDHNHSAHVLRPYSHFGETALLYPNMVRTVSVDALTYCELLVLSRSQVDVANELFPAMKRRFAVPDRAATYCRDPTDVILPTSDIDGELTGKEMDERVDLCRTINAAMMHSRGFNSASHPDSIPHSVAEYQNLPDLSFAESNGCSPAPGGLTLGDSIMTPLGQRFKTRTPRRPSLTPKGSVTFDDLPGNNSNVKDVFLGEHDDLPRSGSGYMRVVTDGRRRVEVYPSALTLEQLKLEISHAFSRSVAEIVGLHKESNRTELVRDLNVAHTTSDDVIVVTLANQHTQTLMHPPLYEALPSLSNHMPLMSRPVPTAPSAPPPVWDSLPFQDSPTMGSTGLATPPPASRPPLTEVTPAEFSLPPLDINLVQPAGGTVIPLGEAPDVFSWGGNLQLAGSYSFASPQRATSSVVRNGELSPPPCLAHSASDLGLGVFGSAAPLPMLTPSSPSSHRARNSLPQPQIFGSSGHVDDTREASNWPGTSDGSEMARDTSEGQTVADTVHPTFAWDQQGTF